MKLSLPARFALLAFFVAGIGVVGVALFSHRDAGNLLREQSKARMANDLMRRTDGFLESIDRMRSDVRRIAASEHAIGYQRAVAGGGYDDEMNMTDVLWKRRLAIEFQILLEQRPEYPQVRYISIEEGGPEIIRLDRVGEDIVRTPESNLQNKGQRDYVQRATELGIDEQYLSRVEPNRERGTIVFPLQPVLRASAAVRGPNGEVVAVVVVNAGFEALVRPFVQASANVDFMIADEKGDFLFHPDKDRQFRAALGGMAGLMRDYPELSTQATGVGHTIKDLPEQSASLIYTTLQYSPASPERALVIAARVSHSLIEAAAQGFSQRLFAGVIVVVVLISIAMAALAKRLIQPIDQLTEAANRLAKGGELEGFPAIERTDELGVLARAFSTMIGNLEASRKEVENLAGSLERQVEDRTHALQRALFAAEKANLAKSNALEVERRQSIELETQRIALAESNKDLNEFAHGVSHDLKAPARQIDMLIQLELDERDDAMHEDTRETLAQVQQVAQRMREMIDGVLAFADVRATDEQPERVELNSVLDETLADFNAAIKASGASITIEALPTVHAHRILVRRLFQNLIDNAIKYRSPERALHIAISARVDPEGVHVTVQDNGRGFQQEAADRVFEPFTRLTGADIAQGAGIGMATARRIMLRFGGQISAQGRPNEGARFELTFPHVGDLERKAPQQPSTDPQASAKVLELPLEAPNSPGAKVPIPCKLLLVDDDIVDLQIARRAVRGPRFIVLTADGHEEALEILRNEEVHVILSDYRMPGRDGRALLRRVARDFPTVRRLLNSGGKIDDEIARDPAVDVYFPKPPTIEKIEAAIFGTQPEPARVSRAK